MRYVSFLLILLLFGCREAAVNPLTGTVRGLSDLPATYQPVQNGAAVAGRLKAERQGNTLSGEWRYNERGQLVEWRHFRNGAVESADQYYYDAAGRLRFVQGFSNNCGYSSLGNCSGPVAWQSYQDIKTDADGRVTSFTTYLKKDGGWDNRSTTTYDYDAQRRLTQANIYFENKLVTTQTFSYDSRGNVVAVREQRADNVPAEYADRTFTYQYEPGRNPYFQTVYFASAYFMSPNLQAVSGTTVEYRADGLPVRFVSQNLGGAGVTVLEYY